MSPAKHRANCENAQRSTGPRTPEGKARASRNARTHGLLSAAVLLADEPADEFAALVEHVTSELAPVGHVERELVSRIAGLLWRLRRVTRVETGLFTDWRLAHAAEQARELARTFVHDELMDMLLSEREFTNRQAHDAAERDAEQFTAARDAPTPRLARAFVAHESAFTNLARYESALESRCYRALHELRRLQDARTGRPVLPPVALDVTLCAGPELRNEPTDTANG